MDKIILRDRWEKLREYTDARIALGRAGSSIPLQRELEFKLAHAHARDAVYSVLDTDAVAKGLAQYGFPVLILASQATSRQTYLQRPDLGRLLDDQSQKTVVEFSAVNDIALILVDGLSATAINRNVFPLLELVLPKLANAGFKPGPVSIVQQGRVAVGDEIGFRLKSKISLVLIGERPGLSAADSMSAYITYGPKPGLTDELRNCVSNIRPGGLPFQKASEKILYIINEAMKSGSSGISLKDNEGLVGF